MTASEVAYIHYSYSNDFSLISILMFETCQTSIRDGDYFKDTSYYHDCRPLLFALSLRQVTSKISGLRLTAFKIFINLL